MWMTDRRSIDTERSLSINRKGMDSRTWKRGNAGNASNDKAFRLGLRDAIRIKGERGQTVARSGNGR
jgi:hypothetical protein